MNPSNPSVAGKPETAPKSYRIGSTIGYYGVFVALGLAASTLGPTLSGLATHTRTGLAEISSLFMARSIGYLLGSGPGGRLYDRLPGHILMSGMLGLMVITLALTPVIPIFWVLFAVMFLLGLGEGNVDVGGNTMLVWQHGDEISPYMNGLHFFFGLGAFFSPIIIARAVLLSGDIHWGYWMLAILMLPMLFWMARFPSPAIPSHSPKAAPVRKDRWMVLLVALFLFFYVGAEISFGGWIYSYATASGLGTLTTAAYLTSAFWLALTVGRLLSVPIATVMKPIPILAIDLAGCLASIGFLLLFPSSSLATWIGTIGVGLSMASVFPTTLLLAGTRMTITGTITGWFFVGSSMGGVVLPRLIGQLFESIGPGMTMVTIMIDLIILLVFFAVLVFHNGRPISRRDQEGT
jgi:MFS transporter, FHS family, Na+ dependent glucose transporter 1